jgi:Cytochrome c552.
MKNTIRLIALFTSAGFILASCEGPRGIPGADGKDGIDANANCTQCHNNDAVVETRLAQWENSVHGTGENAAYADRDGCVQCHTSQGFLQSIATGSTDNLTIPAEPQQINCYTCHNIHKTFTSDDWGLTSRGPKTLLVQYKGADVIYDKGTSNQCVSCHQARIVDPMPVFNGPDFAITNTRLGAHHGPQSNLLLGKSAFQITGSTTYPSASPHAGPEGCVACHMATPYGYMAGGHTWNMMYSAHGGPETLNANGCLTCHSTATATSIAADLTALQTEVKNLLDDLGSQLAAYGIYNSSTGLAKTGTFKANAAMAFLAFNMIEEDRSEGAHNPDYIKAMLNNAISTMTTLGYPPPSK